MTGLVRADIAELGRAGQRVHELANNLARERATVTSKIEDLLGSGWTGDSAQAFAGALREWVEGADLVSDGLHDLGRAIDETRADLQRTDTGDAGSFDQVQMPTSRAAQRLGGAL